PLIIDLIKRGCGYTWSNNQTDPTFNLFHLAKFQVGENRIEVQHGLDTYHMEMK
ncbi:hypothetical protein ACJX0J_035000, partial [Zea mays]